MLTFQLRVIYLDCFRNQVKIAKLEAQVNEVDRTLGITKADRADREMNAVLQEENRKLKAANSILREQMQGLNAELEKKKKELVTAKRLAANNAKRSGSAPAGATHTKPEIEIVPGPNHRYSGAFESTTDGNWRATAEHLKARHDPTKHTIWCPPLT